MPERVPVVEDGPTTDLEFVVGDHRRLDLDTACDPGDEVKVVEVVAAEEVVLGHLAEAAAHLRLGKCLERSRVAQHGGGLPERPHEVLAFGQVDARLAPDGGVDLCQQGSGHVYDGHAPVIGGRREAGYVGDHPAAHTDDDVAPGEPPPGEGATEALHGRHRLGILAVADVEDLLLQARVHGVADARLGHDRGPSGPARQDLGEVGGCIGADEDRVGPLCGQHDVDADHDTAPRRRSRNAPTSSATSSGERPSVSMARSAASS